MIRRALVATLCALTWLPAHAESERRFTDSQWTEDIDTFVETLRSIHINPFHTVSEEEFVQELSTLKAELPVLTDYGIALRIRGLVAMIGDGHTWIRMGDAFAPRRLPVLLQEFADGVFIVGGMGSEAECAGSKLQKIGGVNVEELLDRASPFVSSDNEWGQRYYRLELLNDEAFLGELGLLNAEGTVTLNLIRHGQSEPLDLASTPYETYSQWTDEMSSNADDQLPLYRSRPGDTYWMTYLPDAKALYVQFNAVRNMDGGPHFVGFGKQVMEQVEEQRAEKLIIDLRNNGGGNGDLLNPTIRRIAENNRINQKGRLFVITSAKTFSAALMFTIRMERNTNALFAGTPGGGKPNSYGEFNAFTLPNSGMTGSISSRWHEEGTPEDTRDHIPVDIPVQTNSTEFFTNQDPVLEAVLAY